MNYSLFASESVCAGHPDKICDQISDAILDEALKLDPNAHTGIEALVTTNHITLAGEVKIKKGSPEIPYIEIAKNVVRDLGYTRPDFEFDANNLEVNCLIHQQSADIAMGVDSGGAGDQGMMFGYATNETKNLMPLPISLAHALAKKLDESKKKLTYLKPDGKTEVAVKYENSKPVSIEGVVIAVPHEEDAENEQIKKDVYTEVVEPVLTEFGFKYPEEKIVINGTGRWIIPGPTSDTGLTGRKIVVDTYGGMGRAGGGAFSGKEPSKVDRGAAYAARFLAKNIVAAGLADRAEVQIAYVIGHKEPLSKSIETFGTGKKEISVIEDFAWKLIDLSVHGIIEGLDLKRPIYRQTAAYGHFGRDIFPWEKIV